MNLLDYIKGDRKGKKAHKVELDAMRDPFLNDAIEGFDSVEGNHAKNSEELQEKVNFRTHSVKRRYGLWFSAAAIAILLIVGSFISLFFWNDSKEIPTIAQTAMTEKTDELADKQTMAESVPEDLAFSQQEKTDEVKPAKKSQSLSFTAPVMVKESEISDMAQADKEIPSKLSASKAISDEKISTAQTIVPPRRIKGKVTDQQGEALPGATIAVKGTSIATQADLDGNYALNLPQKEVVIVASYVGMESEIIPNPQALQNITMNESAQTLAEVVVSGAVTTADKRLYTGAAAKVSTDVSAALEGKAAGIQVDKASNQKPEPVIGRKAYDKYLKENLTIPTDECAGKKGWVEIAFFVDDTGSPINLVVIKSLCPSADAEVLRLVKEGPKWTSGSLQQAKVSVKF